MIVTDFPKKLRPLFEPHRYIVVRGGRGGAKSWGVARALLEMSDAQRLQNLCAREYQSSIKESVHKLLANQIGLMQLTDWRIEQSNIYGPRGSQFSFTGLADQTAENIKSFEDFDNGWVEEARVLSQNSLDILLPTIRKRGSRIIFTYNPMLDTDPIEVFANSLDSSEGIVVDMHYSDNPWFNETMEKERARAERTMDREDYENIWEGKLRSSVEGAIYAKEIADMVQGRRIGEVLYDPYHLVYPVVDIGWNDSMAIGFWQRHMSALRLIDYLEDDHKTWDWYTREMRKREYNFGRIFLPHDGGKGNPQTGKTDQSVLEGLGWKVTVLERGDPEQEIRDARMAMKLMQIDKGKCGQLVEHLRRYRRAVSKITKEPGKPLHDEHSHGADMVRYAVKAAPQMDDEEGMTGLPDLPYPKTKVI